MRFLILSQYFPPEVGAPQIRLDAMVRELKRQGHEVEVVTSLPNYPNGRIFPEYRGRFYSIEEWEGVPVHRIWLYASAGAGIRRMLNYSSFSATSFWGLLRARRPDYLFVESPPLFLSIPAFLWAVPQRLPIIFNVADLWPDSIKQLGLLRNRAVLRVTEYLELWAYRKSTYINAVTEGIRQVLVEKKGVPEEKFLFLPNGVNTDLFRPRKPDLELAHQLGLTNKIVILYAGTMGFAQGVGVALDALRYLQSEMPNLQLVFIGGGSERKALEQRAAERKLSNITFLDPAPPEHVARLYSIAYAGLATLKNLPLFEGARPSKVFPIMASGKPVIYSGAGEGARLVGEANAGVVVPPEDPFALAEAIRKLAQNKEWADRLGQNGRRYVEQHLSWPVIIRDWLNQLEERSSQGA